MESLGAAEPHVGASRQRRSTSLLEANVGSHLHAARERRSGRGSPRRDDRVRPVVLCASLGSPREDVQSALLVQALRDEGVDSRPLLLGAQETPAAALDGVDTVFLACPLDGQYDDWHKAVRDLRALLPRAFVLAIQLPLEHVCADEARVAGQVDLVARSFSEAVAFVLTGGRVDR